ncbi:glycosyltransferase family 2 protein [Roseiterribacter gracilis]|uniref:Glycosyl transferase n=1 Tax=Roseiterribacter gracilis TaxID=2812848 RepID=A0A8S8X7V7_9PROT|nr:glycosyl transferase [Rhodospirillales bacterium TMPK1]
MSVLVLLLALLPLAMIASNLRSLHRPRPDGIRRKVSVLLPARDEATNIAAALHAIRAAQDVELEIIVCDDQSSDATAEIVRTIAADDPRVRLIRAPPLLPGWKGKANACWALGRAATHDILLFVDADVRLSPDAPASLAASLDACGVDLVSGVPRQITPGLAEALIVPLIDLLLFGYLPMNRMRAGTDPRFGAAIGQLIAVRAAAYRAVGGHGAVATNMHDGVALARLLRRAGSRTDLVNASVLATCRMYATASEVWRGFTKNATEGLATPIGIWVWSVLLLGGHVLPLVLCAIEPGWIAGSALAASYAGRAVLARRFQSDWRGALAHPLGVLLLVAIQWHARIDAWRGKSPAWRGRVYG